MYCTNKYKLTRILLKDTIVVKIINQFCCPYEVFSILLLYNKIITHNVYMQPSSLSSHRPCCQRQFPKLCETCSCCYLWCGSSLTTSGCNPNYERHVHLWAMKQVQLIYC